MGRVGRAHGLGGELEIRPDWSESKGLLEAERVVLEAPTGEQREHEVVKARATSKGVLLALSGITDRDAAEAVRGYSVGVPRDALPPLADGEYYLCDLVGARVVTPEGPVGTVIEIQMYPSVDALVIEAESGERFEQPLLDEWLAVVDTAAGRIELVSSDGLIAVPRPSSPAPPSET
jgi:16S rRNA processing protein RimM